MLEYQNRSFTRDSRNISILKFVRNKVSVEYDLLATELLDYLGQSHEVSGLFGAGLAVSALHRVFPKIHSTASAKSIATNSGGFGHFPICQANSPSPYPVRTKMLFPPALWPSSISERRSPTKNDSPVSIECSAAARCTIPSFGFRHSHASDEACGQ